MRSATKAGNQARKFKMLVLFAVAANILLGFTLSAFISNDFARPLVRLAGHASQIAGGNLRDAALVAKGGRRDEIGELNRSFAAMATQLHGALVSLSAWRAPSTTRSPG